MAPLVGPPPKPTHPTPTSSNAIIDAFNNISMTTTTTPGFFPTMGYNSRGAATYLDSGNPCLDLFFQVSPRTNPHSLNQILFNAWAHDPLTTLKLICNLRGIRGHGKSDKPSFFTAANWLHNLHPKTLALNLQPLSEFGCFKDFPELLFKISGNTHVAKMTRTSSMRTRGPFNSRKGKGKKGKKGKGEGNKKAKASKVSERVVKIRQEREKARAAEARYKKRADLAKKALERYARDPDYKFLHDRVSDLFAERLREDVKELKEGNLGKISLAAKWCPSLDSCYDRATLLCEAIARRVFVKEETEEYRELEDAHYAYRVRDRLRKEVLVPLRKALELPEVYMSAKRWEEVRYNRVASVAMKTYKEHFLRHDEKRFNEYLDKVKEGKAKIAAGALFPNEIIAALDDDDGGEVAELQWKRMVSDLKEKGNIGNCLAVCDVAWGMRGTPIEVSVSMGLLLSELCDEPWKGKVITFSDQPQMHAVEGDNLWSKAEFIQRMDCGETADFQKVFDVILHVAVKEKLSGEEMVKRVFVFSSMEFAAAGGKKWETDYEMIRRKYERRGYGEFVPELVFWNLKGSKSTPVTNEDQCVALVGGFSKNILKLFLEGKDKINPETVMRAAISGEEYEKLTVLD